MLVTGHTGFKGAWLAAWLHRLGARVTGVALPPATEPSLFALAGLVEQIDHRTGDIRDPRTLDDAVRDVQPEIVFHLAAQALVRESYAAPVETFATNVMGSVHLLEALRRAGRPAAVVMVTTDKCYEDTASGAAHAETDPLGGHDPYSASKACAELAIASYRRSFFARDHAIAVASARAGNVIGAGDWGKDRLVPDCVRALTAGAPIPVRNPDHVRPWQHVLDPLSGYLWLGAHLLGDDAAAWCQAWNFGPDPAVVRSVGDVVNALVATWGRGAWQPGPDPAAPHETTSLRLDTAKARARGWRPVWDFAETARRTAVGYRALADATDVAAVRRFVAAELEAYEGAS